MDIALVEIIFASVFVSCQIEELPFLWNVCKSRMEPDFKTLKIFDQQLKFLFFVDFTSLMVGMSFVGR